MRLTIRDVITGGVKRLRSMATPDTLMSSTRLQTCLRCEQLDRVNQACSLCGCPVRAKVRLADESCPAGKWTAQPATNK